MPLKTLSVVICDPPCENGACVANDTCNCQDGYMGDTCSQPRKLYNVQVEYSKIHLCI